MSTSDLLGQEWITLQNNFEQYEKEALKIKLVSIVLAALGLAVELDAVFLALLLVLLWLQEGVWRTFQARLGARILRLEALIKQETAVPGEAFQLHSEWLAARRSGVALLAEYAASACRPTVALPYAVLVLGLVGLKLL